MVLLKEILDVNWHIRDTGFSYLSSAAARTKGRAGCCNRSGLGQKSKQTRFLEISVPQKSLQFITPNSISCAALSWQ